MAELPSPNTLKRKRGEDAFLPPIVFSFDLSAADAHTEDGSNSPRSQVAHKFTGLALESGAEAVNEDRDGDRDGEVDDDGDLMRKRHKGDEEMSEGPPLSIGIRITGPGGETVLGPQAVSEAAVSEAPIPAAPISAAPVSTEEANTSGGLQQAIPSIDQPTNDDSGLRIKKRVGSPPPSSSRKALPGHEDGTEDDEMDIVNPLDEDDDGTGINGIGFRPTATQAQARAMKRRQQMAEYHKREESEARNRRSQRRRGDPGATIGTKSKSSSRRVRFMDAEPQNIAISTG